MKLVPGSNVGASRDGWRSCLVPGGELASLKTWPGRLSLVWTDDVHMSAGNVIKPFISLPPMLSGLYYKCFTIVSYDRNDSGKYYKATIMIVIDDPS